MPLPTGQSIDWRTTVSDGGGDDTPILVYCDWLDDLGESRYSDLAAILREWLRVRTTIRTLHDYDDEKLDDELHRMIRAYNKEVVELDTEVIEPRKAWMTGRIGGCYTHLHATVEYLRKRPNLLSDQPFRTLTLIASRADQEDLNDVFTNWRLGKIWHMTIPFYQYWGHSEMKLIQAIRQMKPLNVGYLNIRGIRNANFMVSSTLIGLKKVGKGCRLKLGNQPEIVA